MDAPRLLLLLPRGSYRAQAFLAASRSLGVELTVGSDHSSVFATRFLPLEREDPVAGICAAIERAEHGPFDGVLGTDERTAYLAAACSEALGLPGNPSRSVATAHDKLAFRRFLVARGLPCPAFTEVSYSRPDLVEQAPYPCVLKPRGLSASQGVIRADSPRTARAALARIAAIDVAGSSAIAEAYLDGPEVAIEGVIRDGQLAVIALFDKPGASNGPYFEESVYLTPSRLSRESQKRCADAVQAVISALPLKRGAVHAELRLSGAAPVVLELAARPIGGSCAEIIRMADGSSLEQVLIADALGLPAPTLEREAAATGVMMLPIPRAGVLRAVGGLDTARATPGIEAISIAIPIGREAAPPPEGGRYLGFVFARADTTETVETALRQAYGALRIEIEAGGNVRKG